MISINHLASGGHDGGMVEFSIDSGNTWQNIVGACNDYWVQPAIFTENFYTNNDTLLDGTPSFNGTSNGWVESQFQLWWGVQDYYKHTGGMPVCILQDSSIVEVRFRFKSDSIPDSLDGWLISHINLAQNHYPPVSAVKNVNKASSLNIYPNPSIDAIFNFPTLDDEKQYSIEIMDITGRSIMNMPYAHELNLSAYPKGFYFYRVSNGQQHYNGKLIVD